MNSLNNNSPNPYSWKDDLTRFFRMLFESGLGVFGIIAIIALLSCLLLPILYKIKNTRSVVIYTSQDQVYAEPIFQEFTKQTGIKVLPVYDSEAVKTVGLVNRLIAEKDHPQCDVFWNNEELRTRQLAAQNLFRETNGWAAFGYRTRRLVVNTNKLSVTEAPKSLIELTNARWRGQVALAYPLFGTTVTHFVALRQAWGAEGWENWCQALAANQPLLVDGNSVVVKMVGTGEASIGLTDSDDVMVGLKEKLSLASVLPTETLFIPNTVAVIRGAPHEEAAQQLFDYLQTFEVGEKLVNSHALEGAAMPKGKLDVEITDALLAEFDAAIAKLKEIFLR